MMKKGVVIGAVAVVVAGLAFRVGGGSSEFSAQFITLPSGSKAHCNRQGYREVLMRGLVTDSGGNFVKCDARVRPPNDNHRTSSTGALLSKERMDEAAQTSPEAVAQREDAAALQKAETERFDRWEFARNRGFIKCFGHCSAEELNAVTETPEFNAAYENQPASE